jgi:hypothetical protein
MTYTKQTWSDNNPAYPASAARFAYMEQGIADAANGFPAASGDTSGATDYTALQAILTAGKTIKFQPGVTYYINQTLAVTAGSTAGWDMPDDTTLVWAGASGGSVFSTPTYSGTSMLPYYGSLKGGVIIYPMAKITAATKVVYIAQPSPRAISTRIKTDNELSNVFVAGSCGYVLDSNWNPGNPIIFTGYVNGQFDKLIYCRCSHVKFIGVGLAFGNDGIVFDDDSLATAAPPINCEIIGAHTWKMVNSMARLTKCGSVAIIGGSLEQGSGGGFSGSAAWVYADTTFNTRAYVVAPWYVGGTATIGTTLKHFGSGGIRWMDMQNQLDAVYAGTAGTGVPVKQGTFFLGALPFRSQSGGVAVAVNSDVIVVSPGAFSMSSLVNGDNVVVQFIGSVACPSGANPVNFKLWQGTVAQTEGSAPASSPTQLGDTIQVTPSTTAVPVVMSAVVNTSATRFYAVSAASPNAVSVNVKGVLRIQPF